MNYQGQIVYQESAGRISYRKNIQLDTSAYPKGIYYIRIQTDNNIIIRKLVIQ